MICLHGKRVTAATIRLLVRIHEFEALNHESRLPIELRSRKVDETLRIDHDMYTI